jgi:hypothetical protein
MTLKLSKHLFMLNRVFEVSYQHWDMAMSGGDRILWTSVDHSHDFINNLISMSLNIKSVVIFILRINC